MCYDRSNTMAKRDGTRPARARVDRPKVGVRGRARSGVQRRVREIPQRELRNDIGRVLAEVTEGQRFRITVRGQPVAELVPIPQRRTWVPWREVMDLVGRTPLDAEALTEIDDAVDQSNEDPWTRYSTRRSS